MLAQVARLMHNVPGFLPQLHGTAVQVDCPGLGGHYPFDETGFQMSGMYRAQ